MSAATSKEMTNIENRSTKPRREQADFSPEKVQVAKALSRSRAAVTIGHPHHRAINWATREFSQPNHRNFGTKPKIWKTGRFTISGLRGQKWDSCPISLRLLHHLARLAALRACVIIILPSIILSSDRLSLVSVTHSTSGGNSHSYHSCDSYDIYYMRSVR